MDDDSFEPRTSCEEYGHDFEEDWDNPQLHRCTDCGDTYLD